MRREFEKLPIDEQLSNLRVGLRTMVNHVEVRGAANTTDIIAELPRFDGRVGELNSGG